MKDTEIEKWQNYTSQVFFFNVCSIFQELKKVRIFFLIDYNIYLWLFGQSQSPLH